MERKNAIKMEDPTQFASFWDPVLAKNPLTGATLDFLGDDEEKNSLGFMELLGIQELSPSIFDMLQEPYAGLTQSSTVPESSEVVNTPATPNSAPVSSASNGATNDEHFTKLVVVEEEEQKTKKLLKPKKTSHQKERKSRFAFMTKSEVDHLEDGYRWRKYGQKAVKNSHFPRSYYRCTSAPCSVKKRVERSFSDPTIVVTTYEGQHTHPYPMMPRSGFAMQQLNNLEVAPMMNNYGYNMVANFTNQDMGFCTQTSDFLRDHMG